MIFNNYMTKGNVASGYHILIVPERCKGCGYCIEFCSEHILYRSNETNSRGYYVVGVADETKCSGCNTCGKICPDIAINTFQINEAEERLQ